MSTNTECCAAYSDDCKLLAYSSPDGRLQIWDTDAGTLKQEYVPSSHLSAAATCLSWRAQTAAPRHRKQRSRSAGGGGDGPLLALGTPAGSVLVYSVVAGDLQTELSGQHAGAVHCLAWDAAGGHVFSGGADAHALQWAVGKGRVKCKLKAGKTAVHSVCPLPDGSSLLTASRTITWWELASGAQLRTYAGHPGEVTCLRHVPLQLTRDETHQAASVSFALPSEARDVRVRAEAADGAVLVTAVTTDGLLHVFERHLNGVRKKPVRPKLTVRVATEGAAPRQLPVLAARPGAEQPARLHLCHGSFLRPTFERLVSAGIGRVRVGQPPGGPGRG
ncbi:WD repeat-containing protein 43-like [Pollicipes pollicipes]|uniref:WD repeat-containing protein 43-like n=1 Tax=Pollicipes pollicipes TaxID=41117 RepID=UPI001884D8AF|nr:WD repeat-containing protein 43-like [Pollicipes pollicipes]